MNTEVALIFAVSGIAGSVLITQLWQMNWFKRENFKLQKSNIMTENRIKFKKLERELGITSTKAPVEEKGIMDLLKGIDKNKIADILNILQEETGEEVQEEGIENTIMNLVKDNPDIVKKIIGGLGSGKSTEGYVG